MEIQEGTFLFKNYSDFLPLTSFSAMEDVKQCWIYTLKGKKISPTNGYFSEENTNQVNNRMQSCLVARIIIWPYVKLLAEAHGGTDICGDWLSEPASEVGDSI